MRHALHTREARSLINPRTYGDAPFRVAVIHGGPGAAGEMAPVAGLLTYFRAADFPFGEFENLASWYGRIESLPAWRATATAPWA